MAPFSVQEENGAIIRHAVVSHNSGRGSCPVFCLTPRSVLEGDETEEVVVAVTDPATLHHSLRAASSDVVTEDVPHMALATLWVGDDAIRTGSGHLMLSYGLQGHVHSCRLPLKPAKISERNKGSTPEVAKLWVVAKVTLPLKHYNVLTQITTIFMPQLLHVLEEARGHPAVVPANASEETTTFDTVLATLARTPTAIIPFPDGLMLLTSNQLGGAAGELLHRGFIRFNFGSCELELLSLPSVEASNTGGLENYSHPTFWHQSGKVIASLADAISSFTARVAELNNNASTAEIVSSVSGSYKGLTPRSFVHISSESPNKGEGFSQTSSLATAVGVLQSSPKYSKNWAVKQLAKLNQGPGTTGWWAQRCVDAGIIEVLVGHFGQQNDLLTPEDTAGSARFSAITSAASTTLKIILGSAPVGVQSVDVSARFVAAARVSFQAVWEIPTSTLPILQLLVDTFSLPDVAKAAAKTGLVEDLLTCYASYSHQMYGSSGVMPIDGSIQESEQAGLHNPFVSGNSKLDSEYLSSWGAASSNMEHDVHGRSSMTLGRPIPESPTRGYSELFLPIPEHSRSMHHGGAHSADEPSPGRLLPEGSHDSSKASLTGQLPVLAIPGKPNVPRLALPSPGLAGPPSLSQGAAGSITPMTGGLTRSSRRVTSGRASIPSAIRASQVPPIGWNLEKGLAGDSAVDKLGALGRNIGEGLIAGDLGALIGHKRMRNMQPAKESTANASSPRQSSQASDLAAREVSSKWGWAGGILARTSAPMPGMQMPSADSVSPSDESPWVSAKSLILKTLLQMDQLGLSNASENGTYSSMADERLNYFRSPANLLAAELCIVGPSASTRGSAALPLKLLCEGQLRKWVLAACHVLAAAPVASHPKSAPTVLLRIRGSLMRLLDYQSVVSNGDVNALEHLAVHIEILREWLAAGSAPGLAEQLIDCCGEQLLSVKNMLQQWRMMTWGRLHLGLMHAMLGLLGLLTDRASGAPMLGSWLLGVLLEADECLPMLRSYTRNALFSSVDKGPPGLKEISSMELHLMQVTSLKFWAALVQLIGTQPPIKPSTPLQSRQKRDFSGPMSSIPGLHPALNPLGNDVKLFGRDELATFGSANYSAQTGSHRSTARTSQSESFQHTLTRSQAMNLLMFLVEAPTGLALRVLEKFQDNAQIAASRDAGSIHRCALAIVANVFAAPDCPMVADTRLVDFYIHYHFLNFVKLYHSGRSGLHLSLARAHLQVLKSFAGCKTQHIARRFYQLKVCDFLVRELSLEFDHWNNAHSSFSYDPSTLPASAQSSVRTIPLSSQGLAKKDSVDSSSSATPASTARSLDRRPPRVPPLQGVIDKGLAAARAADASMSLSTKEAPSSPPQVIAVHDRRPPVPPLKGVIDKAAAAAQETRPMPGKDVLKTGKSIYSHQLQDLATNRSPRPSEADDTMMTCRGQPEDFSPTSSDASDYESAFTHTHRTHHADAKESRELPPGFKFTGDLDEDVAMLEALESAVRPAVDDSDDSDDEFSISSSSTAHIPDIKPPVYVPKLCIPVRKAELVSPPQSDEAATVSGSAEIEAAENTDLSLSKEGSLGHLQSQIEIGGKLQLALVKAGSNIIKSPTRTVVSPLKGFKSMPAPRTSKRAGPSSNGNTVKGHGANVKTMSSYEGSLPVDRPQLNRRPSVNSADGASFASYMDERMLRGLYRDAELHILVVQVVMDLLLESDGQLSGLYCSQNPHELNNQNIPVLLHHHLNHLENSWLLPRLLESAYQQGPSNIMLLRLLVAAPFPASLYKNSQRVARGAYSTVYRSTLPPLGDSSPSCVALKVIDMPDSIHDHCNHVDVFNEVNVLHTLAGVNGVCQLHDFGITSDSFVLVLQNYKCTLLEWRKRQPEDPSSQLLLYLRIFQQLLTTLQMLHSRGVIHFDIKCENVLLNPKKGVSEEDFWHPPKDELTFDIVFSDFGESKLCSQHGDVVEGVEHGSDVTKRNRGTEFIKSPEMLMVANATKKGRSTYDRRRQEGAGFPSDVWSAGCLLAEIVLGTFLFYDPDWIRFFIRLTHIGEELFAPELRQKLDRLPVVLDLLEFTLVRDPSRRPGLGEVNARCSSLIRSAEARRRMPKYQRAPNMAPSLSDVKSSSMASLQDSSSSDPRALDVKPGGSYFYDSTPVRITSGLLLSNASAAMQKNALSDLGITDMIILSHELPAHTASSSISSATRLAAVASASGVRILLQSRSSASEGGMTRGRSFSALSDLLNKALKFISEAGGLHGHALSGGSAYGQKRRRTMVVTTAPELLGDASTICCAALMEELLLGVYAALLCITWRRMGLGMSPMHMKSLADWYRHRIETVPWMFPWLAPLGRAASTPVMICSCACGAFHGAILHALRKQNGSNPRGCARPLSEGSDCPADCAAISSALSKRVSSGQIPAEAMATSADVKWAWTSKSSFAVDPLSPVRVMDPGSPLVAPGWSVMHCACCGYVTHAVRRDEVAVVCNIQRQLM